MANFGLQDLMVVAPYEPVWQEVRSAVGAEEVVRSARAFERLEEAIGDANLVVGTTAGGRRNLDRDLLPLAELPGWLRARREGGRLRQAALLFGSEKTGLSNEAMSFCHALVQIPTAPQCPSMNLAQAVAVCCYELARAGVVSIPPRVVKLRHSDAGNLQSIEHTLARLVKVKSPEAVQSAFDAASRLREAGYIAELELGRRDADYRWTLEVKPKSFVLTDKTKSRKTEAKTINEILKSLERQDAD